MAMEQAPMDQTNDGSEVTFCRPHCSNHYKGDLEMPTRGDSQGLPEISYSRRNKNEPGEKVQEGTNVENHKVDENFVQSLYHPNKPHPSLEFPPLYFLLNGRPWIREAIQGFYYWRWSISHPLQKRVRGSQFLFFFRIYLTYGEVLLLIPFTVLPLLCVYQTFIVPSISGTGKASRLAVIAALLCAQKNSYITMVLGIPFDRAVPYHKLSGYVALFTGILHALTYLLVDRQEEEEQYSRDPAAANGVSRDTSDDNLPPLGIFNQCIKTSMTTSETFIGLVIIVMFLTSLPIVRRKFFEVFYFVHMVLLLGIIGGTAVHTGFMVPLLVVCTTGVDLLIRKIVMATYRYPKTATLKIISDTVVQISFPKVAGFDYNPGQYGKTNNGI